MTLPSAKFIDTLGKAIKGISHSMNVIFCWNFLFPIVVFIMCMPTWNPLIILLHVLTCVEIGVFRVSLSVLLEQDQKKIPGTKVPLIFQSVCYFQLFIQDMYIHDLQPYCKHNGLAYLYLVLFLNYSTVDLHLVRGRHLEAPKSAAYIISAKQAVIKCFKHKLL